jgi:O-acetyl-ADP-ribose deacetylase (regulator of RNase III)
VTSSERVYKGVVITVTTGDITKLKVDAIVNPANSQLIMGGGVAGAILRAGGREIQEEAVKKAPVPVGKAIATRAGKLKAKYVIHAPTMERPAMTTGKEEVKLAMRGALKCAYQLDNKSVAFPGMGTGVGGLDVKEAAQAMVDEIKKHIESGTRLEKVILVGFDEDLTSAFANALS